MLRKSGIACSSEQQSREQQKMFAAHDLDLSFWRMYPDHWSSGCASKLLIIRKMAVRILLRTRLACADSDQRMHQELANLPHPGSITCHLANP
jgi:hypothetical protein